MDCKEDLQWSYSAVRAWVCLVALLCMQGDALLFWDALPDGETVDRKALHGKFGDCPCCLCQSPVWVTHLLPLCALLSHESWFLCLPHASSVLSYIPGRQVDR